MNDAFLADARRNIRQLGERDDLRARSVEWIAEVTRHQYSHHFTWLGLPIIQFPQDVLAIQEIIWRVRPNLIVETGIARGGSLAFHASMLELIGGDGIVCGIDIDIRPHTRTAIDQFHLKHRIRMIEGSSIDPNVAAQIGGLCRDRDRVLVILDSNHTHEHVLRELELYSPFVTAGSYLIVLDTIIEDLPEGYFTDRPWNVGDNPMTAVREFLNSNSRFEVDSDIDAKLLITVARGGYLRCTANLPQT